MTCTFKNCDHEQQEKRECEYDHVGGSELPQPDNRQTAARDSPRRRVDRESYDKHGANADKSGSSCVPALAWQCEPYRQQNLPDAQQKGRPLGNLYVSEPKDLHEEGGNRIVVDDRADTSYGPH
jgi:hypothetical protein